MPIVTCLYVFMNVAYMTVLEKEEMINSVAVGMSFGEKVLGPFSFLIPLGVALSTFGCALSIQFGVTRLCYVSAKENHLPEPLSYIHGKTPLKFIKQMTYYYRIKVERSTPAPAVFLQGILALIFLVVGDISTLIDFASFLIWFFYGCAMVALLGN